METDEQKVLFRTVEIGRQKQEILSERGQFLEKLRQILGSVRVRAECLKNQVHIAMTGTRCMVFICELNRVHFQDVLLNIFVSCSQLANDNNKRVVDGSDIEIVACWETLMKKTISGRDGFCTHCSIFSTLVYQWHGRTKANMKVLELKWSRKSKPAPLDYKPNMCLCKACV